MRAETQVSFEKTTLVDSNPHRHMRHCAKEATPSNGHAQMSRPNTVVVEASKPLPVLKRPKTSPAVDNDVAEYSRSTLAPDPVSDAPSRADEPVALSSSSADAERSSDAALEIAIASDDDDDDDDDAIGFEMPEIVENSDGDDDFDDA